MKYTCINIKKMFLTALLVSGSYCYSQVRIVNTPQNLVALSSSAFIDASSNDPNNQTPNIGKGLLYPRTDLTTFTSFSGLPVGIANSYPFFYE